ncbi:thymidylate kinase [Salpingoeca rosetta]|uniref:Thymidylate kinase n=1 Tax=Salpingoeca rosetta (strain ATCC 50818 / BSB-021) TaxID=946362 RepID=F2UA04_SALR5|nr:thymidylate kinase [Salpingoeca rosetta]EGD73579.1 thymidylate kinase [Salpingoeca rosetta]|eukprot:XP_004993861.1 thymidylate kinase [Salpingoeca rosetta]
MARRGVLIVLEGTDRCGKSTQCKLLVEKLASLGHEAKLMRFPERSTVIGGVIDKYLRKEIELDDHAAHLLFSANRWELVSQMKQALKSGVSLVIDRYAFSGVAFTSAKGLDMDWCKSPDANLPSPDLHIHLELDPTEAAKRVGFGSERYEVTEFQAKVKAKYEDLYASMTRPPRRIDVAGLSIEDVHAKVLELALEQLQDAALSKVDDMVTLW